MIKINLVKALKLNSLHVCLKKKVVLLGVKEFHELHGDLKII